MQSLHRIVEAKYRLSSEMYNEDYTEHVENHKLSTLRDLDTKVFNGILDGYTDSEISNLKKLFKFIRYFDT